MNDVPHRPQVKTRKALTPLLEIRNLTKSFDGQHAVDDVSLTIYKGEIFALLGASGCGKSTLLRMLAGFEPPSSGQIMLDGVDLAHVPPYQRPINMMFQSYALFPHMTVEQNIAFGLKQDKLPKAEITSRVNEMLGLVHMQEFAKRKPHQLSGGQRQRVALARSLAKRPKLLLLDEPMGALDKKLRDRMQLEVVDILERVGVTCVMVTHDQEEAMTMAVVLGTIAAVVMVRFGRFRGANGFAFMITAPLVMPDVITGLSLLLLFVALGHAIGWPSDRGMLTIWLAHVTFCTAYVAVVIASRLRELDRSIEEAAMDLGAPPLKVFFVITLPMIMPAVISGWLLAFTLSLDDLVIASFVSGPGATTLPMLVFSSVRMGVNPEINALATLILGVVGIIGFIAWYLMARAEKQRIRDIQRARRG